jgi:hypothetical protein
MNSILERKNEGGKPDKNSSLRRLEFMPRNLEYKRRSRNPSLESRSSPQAFPSWFFDSYILSFRMRLQCFYVYEAPHLTIDSFTTILESCPSLKQFGNLSRWAVNCEGIQQIGRTY